MRKNQTGKTSFELGSDLENMAKVKKPARTRTSQTEYGYEDRPYMPWTAYNRSTPEHDLLLRYRHVYAGKGGKYGGPSVSPPFGNVPFVKYSKEILQKISKALRQQENVDAKVSQVQQPQTGQPSVNNAQNKSSSKSLLMPTKAVGAKTPATNARNSNNYKTEKRTKQDSNLSNHKTGITFNENVTYTGFTTKQWKKEFQKLSATPLLGSGFETPISESMTESATDKQIDSRGGPSNDTNESTRKNMNLFSRMSMEAQAALRDMTPEGMTSHNTSYDVIEVEDGACGNIVIEGAAGSSDEELTDQANNLHLEKNRLSESPNFYRSIPNGKTHLAVFSKSNIKRHKNKMISRTKLPHISSDQVTLTSSESTRGEPTTDHIVPGIGRFSVVLNTGITREQTFKITPQGYDSRYTESMRILWDDTPEEIKAEAVAKCSDWINKYL